MDVALSRGSHLAAAKPLPALTVAGLVALFAAVLPVSITTPERVHLASPATVVPSLRFEPNRGQAPRRVEFIGRAGSYTVALSAAGATVAGGPGPALAFTLQNGDRHARGTTSHRLTSHSNYFLGSDRDRWIRDLPNFGRVLYADVYRGVDVTYLAGAGGALRHDFTIHPGADPAQIVERYATSERVDIVGEALKVQVGRASFRVSPPVAYQDTAAGRRSVDVSYRRVGRRSIGYQVGAYDSRHPLVIDPTVAYSTYLGGAEIDTATAVAVDSAGRPIVVGRTNSLDFPVGSPRQQSLGGNNDAFISKFTADGSQLEWSTYLGGSDHDLGLAVTVSKKGSPYISGTSCSYNYPVKRAVQKRMNGACDVFLTKLSANGSSIDWSTYVGGRKTDRTEGVVLDKRGGVYMVGETNSDRPVRSKIQSEYGGGLRDAFVTKLKSDGSKIVYFTLLGGKATDRGRGITVDGRGSAYVTGFTNSLDFPVKRALQKKKNGPKTSEDFASFDAFVTKVNPEGTRLSWSTFFGGKRGEAGFQIKVAEGKLWVAGRSQSTDLRTTRNAFQPIQGGGHEGDGMLFKMNRRGSKLPYSTYLGGEGHDRIFALQVDDTDAPIVAGRTDSLDFPLENATQSVYGGGSSDAYVTHFNAHGLGIAYSTYIGGTDFDRVFGNATDADGNAYLVGQTKSPDFPLVDPYQETFGGGFSDAFLMKVLM